MFCSYLYFHIYDIGLFIVVLKPFKAYLVERCGSSVWLKLFRRITDFATSLGRTGDEGNDQADILMTIPPPNPIEHEVDNIDVGNNAGKLYLSVSTLIYFEPNYKYICSLYYIPANILNNKFHLQCSQQTQS